jgi:sugar lactone lactonase YvrE
VVLGQRQNQTKPGGPVVRGNLLTDSKENWYALPIREIRTKNYIEVPMKIELSQMKTVGNGLVRPEGVMAADDGTIYTTDGRGQCARIAEKGETTFLGDLGGLPNGLCLDKKGNCIVANIGNGQVQSLLPAGSHKVLMTEADGKRMLTPNFPFIDSKNRLWVSNSTDHEDLNAALQGAVPDGSLVLIENGRSSIVAEGICFANGLTTDADETYLYVAETMKRRILRFKMAGDGSLSGGEVYGPDDLGSLGYPDGIAFDEAGNLWITFPAWNAVGYLASDQVLHMVLEDPERKVLRRPTNICFGWEGRKTAFIGSLEGTSIPYFEVPFPGMRLIHQKI